MNTDNPPKELYIDNLNSANIPNTAHSLKMNNPISNFDINSESKSNNNNPNNVDKLQELIESQKIISTLRSIKTSNSINYDDIKLLPSLFLDMQEALKKSNANVLDLKETIKEKIQNEKKLRTRIKELEQENKTIKESLYKHKTKSNELKLQNEQLKLENSNLAQNFEYTTSLQKKYEELINDNKLLKRKNDEYRTKVDNYEDEIENLKMIKTELENKNKKYKSAHGMLQNEISSIEEHLEDVKNFQQEIKKMQIETKKMKEEINSLEDEKKKLKEDNLKYISIVKNMKVELKSQLNEKINIVKEMETLKNEQRNFASNHDNLKTQISNTLNLNEKLTKEKNELTQQLEEKTNELSHFEELKNKYTDLYEDFGNMIKENSELRQQLQDKKFTDQDLNKLQEKFETELFNSKSESNIWKYNFLDIAKFKLIKYDSTTNANIESILQIDKNYVQNAPKELQENSLKILSYFKHLIEQESYQSINVRQLKETLSQEQEKLSYLQEKLNTEMYLRRKIHNRYMYLRGNLRVMCRIRPFLPSEVINKKSQMETYNVSSDTITIRENGKYNKSFEFDYIFNQQSSQNEVYEEATLLIQSMLQGNNVCIIAYGQTCTGKTYTIQGPDMNHPGVATRAAKELFELISKDKSNQSVRLTLTIIEIYNEQIYNLLDDSTPSLSMYENSSGNLVIPDLTPISISSFTEAVKLFKLASKFRHTSSTEYNDRSSRSHCIFTFKLKMVGTDGAIKRSTLNIIDLAGSERISKSKCEDELTKKEAISINLSLHALSSVLNSISIKASHVPYRDSKLTHFLKESLNDNYNILLILHISPHVKDIGETISTLQFGTRIVKICKHKTGKDKINLLGNNKEDDES